MVEDLSQFCVRQLYERLAGISDVAMFAIDGFRAFEHSLDVILPRHSAQFKGELRLDQHGRVPSRLNVRRSFFLIHTE
jgi:hypothetical protein